MPDTLAPLSPSEAAVAAFVAQHMAHPADRRDAERIARASYFTVFRCRGRGAHLRERHDTLLAARTSAAGDPRALIYAITPQGEQALVPKGYPA